MTWLLIFLPTLILVALFIGCVIKCLVNPTKCVVVNCGNEALANHPLCSSCLCSGYGFVEYENEVYVETPNGDVYTQPI